jgi:hypothetical protein
LCGGEASGHHLHARFAKRARDEIAVTAASAETALREEPAAIDLARVRWLSCTNPSVKRIVLVSNEDETTGATATAEEEDSSDQN